MFNQVQVQVFWHALCLSEHVNCFYSILILYQANNKMCFSYFYLATILGLDLLITFQCISQQKVETELSCAFGSQAFNTTADRHVYVSLIQNTDTLFKLCQDADISTWYRKSCSYEPSLENMNHNMNNFNHFYH